MWAADAVRFGYRWNVGDGAKVRFWEALGSESLPFVSNFGTRIVFAMRPWSQLIKCGMV